MKKIMIILVLIMFSMTLTGCYDQFEYRHNDPGLYTESVYSLLGVRSYYDDSIIMIEEDSYGRVLYLHQAGRYDFEARNFTALLVSQYSEDGRIYYYQDKNFIMIDAIVTSENLYSYFSTDEIQNLKDFNDWNKDIDSNKCVNKEIIRVKSGNDIPEESVVNKINSKYADFDGSIIWCCYFDKDTYGRHIFFIQDISTNASGNYDYLNSYIVLVDIDGKVYEDGLLLITDMLNYQEQLANFRLVNNWNEEDS